MYYEKHIFFCTNQKAQGKQCCAISGGEEFMAYMKDKLLELNMHGHGAIRISKAGCLGRCSSGPCLVIYPEAVWYTYSSFADIDDIINSHLLSGVEVKQLLLD